jgi:nitrogen fixation protein NifU and related proteins
MSSAMESLYQEVILDLSRHPHGKGLEGNASGESHQVNPTCGDEVTLEIHLDPDTDRIRSVRWDGHGCAISQASASLFSDLAPGLSTAELSERVELFRTAMRSKGTIEPDEDLLGDAVALGGVSRYVARVKCAMLAWVAGEEAISKAVVAGNG